MEITIGTKVFRTKTEAKKQIGIMKNGYKEGDILNDNDFNFVIELLKRHPYYDQKKGVGIESISVKRNEWGRTGFFIKRIDKTTTDFSYIFCINNKVDYKKDFIAAARQEIKDQILSWKNKNFSGKCECCGCNVDYDNCDVDHFPVQFDTIVNSYITEYTIYENFKGLTDVENWDDIEGKHITDEDVSKSWKEYHAKNAKYRIACIKCNRGKHFS